MRAQRRRKRLRSAPQEEVGLAAATDGELRRRTWIGDFFAGLEGMETMPLRITGKDRVTRTVMAPAVTGRVAFTDHPTVAHFEYLAARTTRTPKMTIPGPTMLVSAARDCREIVSREAYPDIRELYRDLGAAYRRRRDCGRSVAGRVSFKSGVRRPRILPC